VFSMRTEKYLQEGTIAKLRGTVRFETFMAMNKKTAVFWDVTPRGSCRNRCFGGMCDFHHQGDKDKRARNKVSYN
jgi:hypothetical protein